MSYDLYFTAPPISRDEFGSHFEGRARYQMEGSQAWYANEDSGVYFSFDYNSPSPGAEEDAVEHTVAFNMNYFRPHFFVNEAEPEVSSFVERFGCEIYDPQNEGMSDGPYSGEGFTRGWQNGNEFGYQAVLGGEHAPESVYARSTVELDLLWQWNFKREERVEAIEKDIFIPRIMFLAVEGELFSSCVWPDAIPTVIPRVDRLLFPREELAPRSLFRRSKDDMCLIGFEEALTVLGRYQVAGYELDAYELPSPVSPPFVKKFVKGLQPFEGDFEGVPMDQVLNREIVERFFQGKVR